MASFVIAVATAPYLAQSATTAFLFAQTVVAKQHDLIQVFFYNSGCLTAHPKLESDLAALALFQGWQALAEKSKTALRVCSSACVRYGLYPVSLPQPFQAAGSSQFVQALMEVDRYVSFGH